MKNVVTNFLLVGIVGFTVGTAQAQTTLEQKLSSDKKSQLETKKKAFALTAAGTATVAGALRISGEAISVGAISKHIPGLSSQAKSLSKEVQKAEMEVVRIIENGGFRPNKPELKSAFAQWGEASTHYRPIKETMKRAKAGELNLTTDLVHFESAGDPKEFNKLIKISKKLKIGSWIFALGTVEAIGQVLGHDETEDASNPSVSNGQVYSSKTMDVPQTSSTSEKKTTQKAQAE